MSKLTRTILPILLTCLPCTLIACGSDKGVEWEADTVTQSITATEGGALTCLDGKVALQIPAGALEEDTEVTLSVLPRSEWTEDESALEPLGAVCRLEPDGLELLKPAGLSMSLDSSDMAALDLPEGTMPACVILTRSDEGEWELLDGLSTAIDGDTGDISVAAETTHFCDWVASYDHVTVELSPRSVAKGDTQSWPATVEISNYNRVPVYLTGLQSGATGAVGFAGWGAPGAPGGTIDPGKSISADSSWRCEATGQGEFLVAASYARDRRYSDWAQAEEKLNPGTENPGIAPPADYDFGQKRVLIVVSGVASCYVEETPPTVVDGQTTETTEGQNEGRRPIGELTFSPNPGDFHDVLVGSTKNIKVTLHNTGQLDAEVLGFLWPTGRFTAVSTVPRSLSLPVGASYDFTIQFAPKSEGKDESSMWVMAKFPYRGVEVIGFAAGRLIGNGVLTEVSSLLMEGSWQCADADTAMTLDFQTALRDETGGDNPITGVEVFIDDRSTAAYSSGLISLEEFPPPPGMIFEREVERGPHEVAVKATTADGEVHEKSWQIDCTYPGGGNDSFAYWVDYLHVEPGKSEAYFDVEGSPGADVSADLAGPGVVSDAHQDEVIGLDGTLRLVWNIDAYGEYKLNGTIDGKPAVVVLIVRTRRVE